MNKKTLLTLGSWSLYDWANSAFPTVITTFIFAAYFTESVAKNAIIGTSDWGYTVAISGLIIALASPVLGSIADRFGRRKPWIAFFTIITIIATSLLWFIKPGDVYVMPALVLVTIATICFEIGTVFYNSMLPDISPPGYIGRVSGWGWGLGYLGGLACLSVALFFVDDHFSWFNHKALANIRISGPLVGVWFAVFSLPLFFYIKEEKKKHKPLYLAAVEGVKTLLGTFRQLRNYKNIFLFLLARLFYIDGLNTIFAFGGIYAAGTFSLDMSQVILFGIAVNVTAGLGAFGFGWLDDVIGPKPTILISLVGMLICGLIILLTHSLLVFWIFGLTLGIFVGPVQAASRSLMARFAPKHLMTEMFGLFAFSGKATSFLGPWLLATLTEVFVSQRVGMASALVLMLVGMIILLIFVSSPTQKELN